MSCNSTIYYPDFNGIFESVIMTENTNAIYSHNFTVPSTEGVYIDAVLCNDGAKTYYGMHTFHVAPWANQAFNNSQNLADIYDLLVFVNSTTIEINGTLYNLQTYINGFITDILIDINTTLEDVYSLNLEINNTLSLLDVSNLEDILTKIIALQSYVEESRAYSDEQVFLITDSVGLVQSTVKDTFSKEEDIEVTLTQVQNNLKRFLEVENNKETPSNEFNFKKIQELDTGLIILFVTVLGVLVLSQFNGLIKLNKKEKTALLGRKKEERRLPSIHDRRKIYNPYFEKEKQR
jgi:hypothetical protein